MRVNRSYRQTAVFVLKWPDVERLIQSVSSSLPLVEFSASCSDKLNRTFLDIAELKAFRNAERSAINELSVVAYSSDHRNLLRFTLNSDERNNVRFTIDAEEAIATRLNEYCEDFLASVRPWYSLIAKADWAFVIWILWTSFFLIDAAVGLYKAKSFTINWPKGEIPESVFLAALILGTGAIIFCWLIQKLSRRYFPTGTFAFGDGENRHTSAEVIRTVVIAGIAISVLVSIAFSLFV